MRVLIATFFRAESLITAVAKLGAEKIVLLIDEKPVKYQLESLKKVKETFGGVIDIEVYKTPMYDVYSVAKTAVEIIDKLDKKDEVNLAVFSGRRPKAVGLMFAGYSRANYVNKIVYLTEEKGELIYLPKISFKLTESQKMLLDVISRNKFKSRAELAEKVKMSRAMAYRAVDELVDKGYVSLKDGIWLTDEGRLAGL